MSTRTSTDSRGLRPPRIRTSLERPNTAPHPGTATAPVRTGTNLSNNSTLNGAPETAKHHDTPTGHQRFVLTDPLAFRYLEDDPSTQVLERSTTLQGYECYVIEQWTTSRSHPTFTITTYTGDLSHTIVVGVLSVPTDEAVWSPRLRVYFKALNQYHARRRETPLGILMVTNLSGFPSSLTVIPVPDGDLKKHRSDFFVNEDLKRLNCSGRVGLTLTTPAAATIAKFHQLYRTSDKNDIYHSVIELVKLCQSALMLFDKLEIDYADGLLCDVTERAINDWWLEIGSQHYGIEPHDGILGPTTVAGLLGLLMGARNRLHTAGAQVGKDAFDVEAMKRGIGAFQKQQRIPRTRRLDRKTLDRLHRSTVKAANSEGWTVPKAVKSTVAELSGKGGEMVLDVVGRRDRAGISEIETCDIERFVQLVYGDRARWLWYGKAIKKSSTGSKDLTGVGSRVGEEKDGLGGKTLMFKEDEGGGYSWTARKSNAGILGTRRDDPQLDEVMTPLDEEEPEEEEGFRGVLKRTSGFKEARSGLGRFKGAVGLGGHRHTHSKDLQTGSPQTPQSPQSPRVQISPAEMPSTPRDSHGRRPAMRRSLSSPVSSIGSPQSPVQEQRQQQKLAAESILEHAHAEETAPAYASSYREAPPRPSGESYPPSYMSKDQDGDTARDDASDYDAGSVTVDAPSIAGSVYNDVDLIETLPTGPETEVDVTRLLKRTVSHSRFITTVLESRSDDRYPRHLSFSLAEESILTWEDVVDTDQDPYAESTKAELAYEDFIAKNYRHLRHLITDLETQTATFTQEQLQTLNTLLEKVSADTKTLESMYAPQAEHLDGLKTTTDGILRAERERLAEAGKDIEGLAAKLEYEVGGLKGRVEDVEGGVQDFEKGVGRVEARVGRLEEEERRKEEKRGWRCVVS